MSNITTTITEIKNTVSLQEWQQRILDCQRSGSFTCPNGKKLVHAYDNHPKSENGFRKTKQNYICESCAGCPHREKCFKGQYENRKVSLSQTFARQK